MDDVYKAAVSVELYHQLGGLLLRRVWSDGTSQVQQIQEQSKQPRRFSRGGRSGAALQKGLVNASAAELGGPQPPRTPRLRPWNERTR